MKVSEIFSREGARGAAAVGFSVLFYALSMPGADVASLAWVWAVPMALWAATRPRWKSWLVGSAVCAWLGGALTLIWLRNLYPPLGWLAVLLLPLAYSAFPFAWLAALRLIFPASGNDRGFFARLLNLLGLAGFWVLLEWMLTWALSGFPWMPLGATQWERPAMLAYCPWTGTAGASFLIVFFNLGAARYIRHIVSEARRRKVSAAEAQSLFRSIRNLCPEFYCALIPVLLSVFVYWNACLDFAKNNEKYFSFAAVQTDFDPQEKWDAARGNAAAGVLETLTLEAARGVPAPDFVLWPEAALPFPTEDPGYRAWLEDLSARAGKPIVFGAVTFGDGAQECYYNAVRVVYPKSGLADMFFAKRHLVPFGEYMPLADFLPFRKIVPMAADCAAGTSEEPLPIFLKNGTFAMGVLVCYEDVFPQLGRDLARRGADFLAVVTNDAWYGREAGAYQHAAHSVMQAVSLGVPVVRCGNAGWSGVINPLGHMAAMTDTGTEAGTIYFRGQESFAVHGWKRRDADGNALGAGGRTFYARHGDWFVTLGGLLFLSAYLRNRRWRGNGAGPRARG